LNTKKNQKVIVIVGPTASGKTTVSLKVASLCQGEIVSADSRQVYRHMDIGTAKPTPGEIGDIPHHCIDIRNPDERFSAGEYGLEARQIISEIFLRGNTPVIVGGSGLYVQALIDGVFNGNYRDLQLRKRMKEHAVDKGLSDLYKRLCSLDPVAAQRIHPNDARRIIRALEVVELSGQPISQLQARKTEPGSFVPVFWGLEWNREELYCRINKRVDHMLQAGLVQEVKKLKAMGYTHEDNSLDSVGYKEILAFLEGTYTIEEAIQYVKQNSRRFAKRQLTWFRRDSRIHWIHLEKPVAWDHIANTILKTI